MPFKLNPITGQLDLVNSNSAGFVTGVPPTTDKAIARWQGTTGTIIEDSPYSIVQDGGAIQANGFITNRTVDTTIEILEGYTMLSPNLEIEDGEILIEGDGELAII